jgi:hypothetical protein
MIFKENLSIYWPALPSTLRTWEDFEEFSMALLSSME